MGQQPAAFVGSWLCYTRLVNLRAAWLVCSVLCVASACDAPTASPEPAPPVEAVAAEPTPTDETPPDEVVPAEAAPAEAAPAEQAPAEAAPAEVPPSEDSPAASSEASAEQPVETASAPPTREYIECGCGCCGGVEPRNASQCVSDAELDRIIAQDKKASRAKVCAMTGCSLGTRHWVCAADE